MVAWRDLVPGRGPRLMASVHSVGRSIPPIEGARPGDRQVLVRAVPPPRPATNRVTPELLREAAERRRARPIVPLDSLNALPSVESVVAAAPVATSVTLPAIRELLLLFEAGVLPDRGTLTHLPTLEAVYFQHAQQNLQFRIELVSDLPLRRLALHWLGIAPREIARLATLTGLQELSLDAGPHANVAELARLEQLQYLALSGGRSGWKALSRLEGLVEAHLAEPSEPSLGFLKNWPRLRTLSLFGPNIRSLAGVEHAQKLEWLRLSVLKAGDLKPLVGLRHLRWLELDELSEVMDLAPLSDLESVEEVRLTGRIQTRWRLGALDALVPLQQLRVLVAYDVVTPAAIERFRRRRPDVRIETSPALADRSGERLAIHPPLEGTDRWWVLQDLTRTLGIDSNAEAEALLRQLLVEEDPELLGRIVFDSEADAVGISAGSESDLRHVDELLGAYLSRQRT